MSNYWLHAQSTYIEWQIKAAWQLRWGTGNSHWALIMLAAESKNGTLMQNRLSASPGVNFQGTGVIKKVVWIGKALYVFGYGLTNTEKYTPKCAVGYSYLKLLPLPTVFKFQTISTDSVNSQNNGDTTGFIM